MNKDYYDNTTYKPIKDMSIYMKAKIWSLAFVVVLVILLDDITAIFHTAFKRLYKGRK